MKQRINHPSFLFVALLLVHLLFFLSSLIHTPAPFTDSEDFLNASRNLYGQGTLYCGDLSEPIIDEQFTRRPPLYPIFLGIRILSGSNIPVFLLQILVSLLSILLVYRIFVSGVQKQRHTIFVIVLLLATPAQFIYSSRIMAEIPFQLLLVLMAWCTYHYFQTQKAHFIWLFNLFLTLGMAVKPVLFPFVIVIIILSLFLFIRTRKRTIILALILPILWISIYSIRNFNRTGSAQYSSIQTANMVNYNLRYFILDQEGSDAASKEVDRLYSNCASEKNYREKIRCLGKGVRNYILRSPVKYGLFHLKGCIRYFLDPGRFDLVTFFQIQEADSPGFLKALNKDGLLGAFRFLKHQGWGLVVILVLIALFKLIKVTGFLLYLFQKNEQLQLRIFLVILVGYLALVTGPLGASRFMLPVELLIIGGAVKGWAPLLLRVKPSS